MNFSRPYLIGGLQTQQQAIHQLAIVAAERKPYVQMLLQQFGYSGDYIKAMGQAMFNPEFIAALAARHLPAKFAHALGDAALGGIFDSLGSLFQMGGSIAGAVAGGHASQAQADAAKANAQAQLEASYNTYQSVLADAASKTQGYLANMSMLKIVFIGSGVLIVLIVGGLIAYKMLT